MSDKISGGYYIWARQEENSWIAHAPPHVREIFRLLVRRANYKNHGKIQRGQCLITFKDIADALSWKVGYRNHKYKKTQIDNAIRSLRSKEMIETAKTTRGMIVSVVNYERYQDPNNYEKELPTITTTLTTATTTGESVGIDSDSNGIAGSEKDTVTTTITSMLRHDKERKKETKPKYIYSENHFKAAVHLKETVLLRVNVNISTSDLKNWANQIRLLETKDKIDPLEIEFVLSWYRNNWDLNQFIPVIQSGKGLREKWLKLQNAISRNKQRGGTHNGFDQKDYQANATQPDQIPEWLKQE